MELRVAESTLHSGEQMKCSNVIRMGPDSKNCCLKEGHEGKHVVESWEEKLRCEPTSSLLSYLCQVPVGDGQHAPYCTSIGIKERLIEMDRRIPPRGPNVAPRKQET